jgi:hypothetical protein
MPTRLATEQIENLQQIEIAIAGPEGATRQFVIAGLLPIQVYTGSQGANFVQQKETFTVLVGPILARQQFIQALATAALARTNQILPAPGELLWALNAVDADWDDESKQTELRVEVAVGASGANNGAGIGGVTFQVTVVAALPQ